MPGDRTQLGKAKPKRFPRRQSLGIFVHARGQANGVWESQTENLDGQGWSAEERLQSVASPVTVSGPSQGAHGAIVDSFGVLGEESRADEVAIKPAHTWFRGDGLVVDECEKDI